jgi:hypothetical protein
MRPMTARAFVTDLGDDLFALHIDLVNDSAEPVEVPIGEPFLDFTVVAVADAAEVPVDRPDLRADVHRTTVRIPAHRHAKIETPIRLRIAAGAGPGDDPYVWTVAHTRDGLAIHLDLELPSPYGGECDVFF